MCQAGTADRQRGRKANKTFLNPSFLRYTLSRSQQADPPPPFSGLAEVGWRSAWGSGYTCPAYSHQSPCLPPTPSPSQAMWPDLRPQALVGPCLTVQAFWAALLGGFWPYSALPLLSALARHLLLLAPPLTPTLSQAFCRQGDPRGQEEPQSQRVSF